MILTFDLVSGCIFYLTSNVS